MYENEDKNIVQPCTGRSVAGKRLGAAAVRENRHRSESVCLIRPVDGSNELRKNKDNGSNSVFFIFMTSSSKSPFILIS